MRLLHMGTTGPGQAAGVQLVALGRANLLVTGRSPRRERGSGRRTTPGPRRKQLLESSPGGGGRMLAGVSCLCQKKPGPEPTFSAFLCPSQTLESGLMGTGPGAGNQTLTQTSSLIPRSLRSSGEKPVNRSLRHTARILCGLGQVIKPLLLLSVPICEMG